MSLLTIKDINNFAKLIKENSDINTNGLELTYTLPKAYHKKINEEIHYRVSASDSELDYSTTIELNWSGVNFKLIASDE